VFSSLLNYSSDLEWGYGARAMGMGRAYVALSNDASGIFWNPSGVINLQKMQALVQMSMLYDNYSLLYGGFAIPNVDDAIGIEFIMFGGAGIEGRDIYNQFTGMIQDTKMSVGATYSKRILRDIYMAVKIKWHMRSLAEYSDMAFAGDFSAMYNITERFYVGVNLLNAFGLIIGETNDKINSQAMFGIAYKEDKLLFSLDGRNNFNDWHFGVEYSPLVFIPLRIGINKYEVSFGGGIRLGMIDADVAYVMDELSDKIVFSMNLNFGRETNELTKEQIHQTLLEANDMLNNDFFYLAKDSFEYVLAIEPTRIELKNVLDRLDKAISFVDSSLKQEKSTWEKYKKAKEYFNEGSYSQSLNLFKEIKQINPNNRFVNYYLDELSFL
jgi:hypothetical protein